ncbi:hypothetical protein [Pseudomonas sp. 02C 26]|uniref:hypothetical protein n=1 Tax=Pseudomonas sp. 02C 26 TaxID=2054914 RepID=UPI0012FF167E|nr:hypothetical protein [Pseudomonas sp. 02C 26]
MAVDSHEQRAGIGTGTLAVAATTPTTEAMRGRRRMQPAEPQYCLKTACCTFDAPDISNGGNLGVGLLGSGEANVKNTFNWRRCRNLLQSSLGNATVRLSLGVKGARSGNGL